MADLLGIALLIVVVIWFLRSGHGRASAIDPREPIDRDALEAAEREVRELDLHQRPDAGFEGDDWGPGASGQKRR